MSLFESNMNYFHKLIFSILIFIFFIPFTIYAEFNYERSIALLIGISNYNHNSIPPLSYADNDTNRLKNCLLQVGGWKEKNITTLLNNDATKNNILDKFISLIQKSEKQHREGRPLELILVYYAGHGEQGFKKNTETSSPEGGGNFIIPVDARNDVYVWETAHGGKGVVNPTFINWEFIIDKAKSMRAKNIVFVFDCCHSEAVNIENLYRQSHVSFGSTKPAAIPKVIFYPSPRGMTVLEKKLSAQKKRFAVFSSSKKTEYAFEDKQTEGGFFTHSIVHTIKNSVNEGEISLGQLFDQTIQLFNHNEWIKYQKPNLKGIPSIFEARSIKIAQKPYIPVITKGRLVIYSELENTSIFIDGKYFGKTEKTPSPGRSNFTTPLEAGHHLIEVHSPYQNPYTNQPYRYVDNILIKKGSISEKTILFSGKVNVKHFINPKSTYHGDFFFNVYIDNNLVGKSNHFYNVLAGRHKLKVESSLTGKSETVWFEARGGETSFVEWDVILNKKKVIQTPKQTPSWDDEVF